MPICIGNHTYLSAIKNNCTSNSRVITQGKAEYILLLRVQLFFNCMNYIHYNTDYVIKKDILM